MATLQWAGIVTLPTMARHGDITMDRHVDITKDRYSDISNYGKEW